MKKVAIIGGGCAGVLMALALFRRARRRLSVVIIEPSDNLGEGVAYSTCNPEHLLNVPGDRMGAYADAPRDFVDWLLGAGRPHDPGDFVPRAWYADYLKSKIAELVEGSESSGEMIHHKAHATCITRDHQSWRIATSSGEELSAEVIILALGLPDVGFPLSLVTQGINGPSQNCRLIASPWKTSVLSSIGNEEEVAILGAGLTAVDTVLSLKSQGHRGEITLLSRHGRLPVRHFSTPPPTRPERVNWPRNNIRRLVREFSHLCDEYRWDVVVDAVRPEIPSLWSELSDRDQKQFLRHCQVFWDIHRHRMAPRVAEKIDTWIADGSVKVRACRLIKATAHESTVSVALKERGSRNITELRYDRLVNCTGYRAVPKGSYHCLLDQMERGGYLRLDPLRLGLRPEPRLSLRLYDDLYVLGALLRSARWESIAVPELRGQAGEIADRVAEDL